MKILYLSQYFPPEIGAGATRVAELSRSWVNAQHKVVVLTGFPNYPTGTIPPEYREALRHLFMCEHLDGVQVQRTWLIPLPNRKIWERITNYTSFCVSAILRGLFLPRPDVVIATSPQLLVGLSGLIIARCKRVPYIFEVRDLWPESLEAVGVSSRKSLMVRALSRLAKLLYRKADHIVVVTDSFKTYLEREWAVPPEKISVIVNGVDPELFTPGVAHAEITQEHALTDRFVAAYIGTVGNAHGLETLVAAAEILEQAAPEVAFLVVGEGAEKEQLEALISSRKLENIRILPAQPREKVPAFIAASDVCLVLLKKAELFKTIVPTKMLEFMSCGRPLVLMVEGEAANLVKRANAGLCIPPEDVQALAQAIQLLKEDQNLREELGRNGRAFILREMVREHTAKEYLTILTSVTQEH